MKAVAILGTGPSGLLAAHAMGIVGKPVAIFGLGEKSRIGGAQFLHYPIPELTSITPDTEITFLVDGKPSYYMEKVYGNNPNSQPKFVSMTGIFHGQKQSAWHLEKVYNYLWESLGQRANVVHVNEDWLEDNLTSFEAVISTIPAPAICRNPQAHNFLSQEIYIGQFCILDNLPDDHIVYNGTKDKSWYRCSKLFGVGGTEWSLRRPPYQTVTVRKPIRTNCDCWPEVYRAGRYGTWRKGELTHDAFYKSIKEMQERGVVPV